LAVPIRFRGRCGLMEFVKKCLHFGDFTVLALNDAVAKLLDCCVGYVFRPSLGGKRPMQIWLACRRIFS